MIPFKNISHRQKMFSTPQIHHKAKSRRNFAIIPPPFDFKNMPNVTPLSEFPPKPKIELNERPANSPAPDTIFPALRTEARASVLIPARSFCDTPSYCARLTCNLGECADSRAKLMRRFTNLSSANL